MKKNLLKTLLALFTISMLLPACSKLKEASSMSTGGASITANFTGNVSSSFQSVDLASRTMKAGVMISISGNTTTLPVKTFIITIPSNTTVGNHIPGNEDATWAFSYTNNANNATTDTWVAPLSGKPNNFTVNITKISATDVEGTFTGTMYNSSDGSKSITTNGSFKGKL